MNKNHSFHRRFWLLSALASIFFVTGCGGIFNPLPYRSLAPFKGKVIDADTKEPIQGAAVLAIYYFTVFGIAGGNSWVEDGHETLTDENGEFELPRIRRWFALHRGYPEGKIIIFKPNYGQFPKHSKSEALGVNKSWPPPHEYIVYELPILNTVEEREKNIFFAKDLIKIPFKKKKLYIGLINEERKKLGVPPYIIPEEDAEQ